MGLCEKLKKLVKRENELEYGLISNPCVEFIFVKKGRGREYKEEYCLGGKYICLLEPLIFVCKGGEVLIVPEGFICDGGSIPTAFWDEIDTPFGRGLPAYIIHDYLYNQARESYNKDNDYKKFLACLKYADEILREILDYLSLLGYIKKWKVWVIYLAVRLHSFLKYTIGGKDGKDKV